MKRSLPFAPLYEVKEVMKSFPHPWFIVGGWALDLALGRKTREHQDIDICIFRNDLKYILDFFKDWEAYVAIPGEHRLLPIWHAEDVAPPRHELHFRQGERKMEFLLVDQDGDQVLFRRNPTTQVNQD